MYIYLQPDHIHTPLVLDCPHSQRTLRTPMRKLHTLMRMCLLPQHPHNSPCDRRRHAPCAARSPVNHWPVPATRRRRRGSNSPDKYTLPHACYTAEFVRSRSNGTSVITISLNKMTRRVPPFKVNQGHRNRHGSILQSVAEPLLENCGRKPFFLRASI